MNFFEVIKLGFAWLCVIFAIAYVLAVISLLPYLFISMIKNKLKKTIKRRKLKRWLKKKHVFSNPNAKVTIWETKVPKILGWDAFSTEEKANAQNALK